MKLKLRKEQIEFLQNFAEIITTPNGKKYYFVPFWFEQIGDDTFTTHTIGSPPNEVKNEIQRQKKIIFKL